jgi:ubiquitin carboxyl-terminal hydrolase 7
VEYESKREEEFYDVSLVIKGCKDVYESFDKYTETELLNGENQ